MDESTENELKFYHNAYKLIGERFAKRIYYTWADLVLISINPFKSSELESEKNELLMKHLKESPLGKMEPHIYSVAKRACSHILMNRKDQIIMIIGDSGSGKTYSTQLALDFLSDNQTPLGKIKYALVILSAFGNAATECHSNSSRFGKLIMLGYDGYSSRIQDASIHTYLLEKTRVSSPTVKNFNIFYQVLAACILSDEYDFHLKENNQFKILPGKCFQCDMKSFIDTLKAFNYLKFKHSTVDGILVIIASILHLGNIEFTIPEGGKCFVDEALEASSLALYNASRLLGIEQETIKMILTHSIISTDSNNTKLRRPSVYHIPVQNLAAACARRDALIKTLYSLLFNWIVSEINLNFGSSDAKSPFKLGLLDIYGFEIFSKNSLEQLCINYANERLHSFFVQDLLLQKRQVLMNEGLQFNVKSKPEEQFFKDCTARISILDAPFSVIGIINEGSLLSRHTGGKELCQRISALPKSKYVISIPNDHKFVFAHFAGIVKYNTKNMVEKNTDKVPNEFFDILKSSENSFLSNLVSKEGPSTVTRNTVLSKFKNSFDSLLKQLKSSQIHYIRCIKPNAQMKPGFIDKVFFEKQLHSSGLLEAVKLSGHCFPVQFTLNKFLLQFHRLISNYKLEQFKYCLDQYQRAIILKWTKDIGLNCQIGEKYIFLSENEFASLDIIRQFLLHHCARVIQRSWRIHWNYKKWKAAKIIQQFLKHCLPVRESHKEISNADDSRHVSKCENACNAVSPSVSHGNVSKLASLSQGDASKVDEDEEDLIGCSVSQNVVSIVCDRGDNLPTKCSSSTKKLKEGKLELMLNWLDNIPTSKSGYSLDEAVSNTRTDSIWNLPPSENISRTKSNTRSSLCSSVVVVKDFPQSPPKQRHVPQSPLFSIANKSYPTTGKLFSYHFLKKIIVKKEKRGNESYFVGNGVVSRNALAKIPIWFHTRKTCLCYSYMLPSSELPRGLEDALD